MAKFKKKCSLIRLRNHSKKSYIAYFTKISIELSISTIKHWQFLRIFKTWFFSTWPIRIIYWPILTSNKYKTGLDFTQQFPNGILSFGWLWFPHYVAKVPWQLWHIWICWLTIIENIMTKCTSLLNHIWPNLVFSTLKAHMAIFFICFRKTFNFIYLWKVIYY